MAEKILITENEKNEIISLYNDGISLKEISRNSKYSFTFIQKLVNSLDYEKIIALNYPNKDGYKIIAVCKKTGKKFYDYRNVSGSILTHINENYQIKLPSKYIRKSKEYSSGKFWYDEYFTFDYEKIKELKKCIYCDWTTEDIENKSGAYEKHLEIIHNKKLNEYILKNPEDKTYFNKPIYQDNELVMCAICGEKMRIINNTHLLKHNISPTEYKLYYNINTTCLEVSNKLSNLAIKTNINMTYKKNSKAETDIINYLLDNNITSEISNRKILNGLEIDIFCEKDNIGIEYNGIVYHSETYGKKYKKYHLNKTLLAYENSVNLIHIFDDEWLYKNDITKKYLLELFNKFSYENINLNETEIVYDLYNEDVNEFIIKNSFSDIDISNNNICLFENNEIISTITFNKDKQNNYIINNYSSIDIYDNKLLFSYLLNNFIETVKPNKIIGNIDVRLYPNKENNIFANNNFKYIEYINPDFWFYNKKLSGKNKLSKEFIKQKLNLYENETTAEWEIMQELGYDRIWGCGKFKYEMIINKI